MHKILKILIPISFGILLFSFLPQSNDCKDFKNGRFYFYPKDSKKEYIVIRKDSLQSEIDLQTGDTSFWKIKWLSDCQFHCAYISGTKKRNEEELHFYMNSEIIFSITKTTKDYYQFEALFKSGSFERKSVDSIWLKKK